MLLVVVLLSGLLGAGMAGGGDCAVSREFPAEVRRWCGLITHHAGQTGLHPDLVAALIWQESGGDEQAFSNSGAVGLMQVMPRDGIAASFVCRGKPCFSDRPTIDELRDPAYNIEYGTRLLKGLVQKYGGNLREALRQYGPIDVGYTYADTVLALYRRYGR
jgi:soluble lytic murein transglycosylase-like protein